MTMRLGWVFAVLVVSACTAVAPVRYERVPVRSTPYTPHKLVVDEVICAEQGKTLACVQTSRQTQDCWCEPR